MIARPKIRRQLPPPTASVALEPAASFEGIALSGLNFTAADGTRATFDEVTLERVDLTSARLRGGGLIDVRLGACELAGADLLGVHLTRVELDGSRASGIVLAESVWKGVTVSGCKLDLANFRSAKLTDVLFQDCSLAEVDFAGAELVGVAFKNCDLSGSEWSGARLVRTDLRTSRLDDLRGVAGLSGATISHEQLIALAGILATDCGLKVES